ncbi:AAA domain-containing protein [Sphingomonas sp. Sphisp140]|uniref:AAA domain-containing protein n=1 Tax=unclassified Sphingomonas TaxID=196159 RepID=UPI0039AF8B76
MTTRDDVLAFLRDPRAFAATASEPELWTDGLVNFAIPSIEANGDRSLRPAQDAAWRGLATNRAGLVLGPPGTGKTHLLSWLITGHGAVRGMSDKPARTFVTAFTKNAVGNVLDAVAKRQALHDPSAPPPIFYGDPPSSGLSPGVAHIGRGDEAEVAAALATGRAVIGATIWSLYRLIGSGAVASADGYTAPLFDLICIDEASQLVLGQGLMALAGMAPDCRIVVSGDDQQLPPVRAMRSTKVEGREVGGSLYAFLKSAEVAEFPLEETFRLNAPLAHFPERKFYPGRYVSAVPEARLALLPDWSDGLDLVTRVALDPALPIVVLVHDGPAAATSNPFEARIAARIAQALAERIDSGNGSPPDADRFWKEIAAIVSPHRAQNAAIRGLLPENLRSDAFVETVDRIQGKERDAVILSYCVADPEFAVAEGEFIFSSERLNVASTRARNKLVLLISRRLLEAVPGEQETMDKAELLREFVFACEPLADTVLEGPQGRQIKAQLRARGFEGATYDVDLTPDVAVPPPSLTMTPELEGVLQAIRGVVARGDFASAALFEVKRAMALSLEPFEPCRHLHSLGWISLHQRDGKKGQFWLARPFERARQVYPVDIGTVRLRVAGLIREERSGKHCFYDRVRDRFAWMDEAGRDSLLPVIQLLQAEGLVILDTVNGSTTLAMAKAATELPAESQDPAPSLDTADFILLNRLEDIEAARINFGVFDAWVSVVDLARQSGISAGQALAALSRLEAQGYLMLAEDGRVRSRVGELAREVRHIKQRFKADDAATRPFLVRNLKLELRNRRKPDRSESLESVFEAAREGANATQVEALLGLERALGGIWGEGAALARFQAKGLIEGLAAWRGDGSASLAIAADTGSGKTEAAALPLIAGALADRLAGIQGTRAVLAYPRVRLAANQAQRLAGYLAATASIPNMPLLTLGLQVSDVPDSFAGMHARYHEAWRSAGPDQFLFPFFACPSCGHALHLRPGAGREGADALVCGKGDWRFDGWVGSKQGLRERPPALFLPTTDSLHQWLHDPRYGSLFGDHSGFAPPRALLADEIHLYTHIHGAQVGLTLRRLAARAARNAPNAPDMLAIGMSATISEPGEAWGRLIGRDDVRVIRPEMEEQKENPRGRETFYFIQPEVESRGADIAGASTTIQSLMCLGHGMRRRTGSEGGYRSLVFFDSIDKMRRLHGAYSDAEEGKELASLRTTNYGDDPTGQPQTRCCGQPIGCDRFADGECWWFAANDARQCGALGHRAPGDPLNVARTPIYSGTSSDAEALVKGADVVFATSSLEVGYDDPDITLVYQHYAPQNLASFVQRKGRGGRGLDDRPTTAVTLSIFSPRDNWWFRRPAEMIAPSGFQIPLNADNFFVRRGQALCALLDGLAQNSADPSRPFSPSALRQAGLLVEASLGEGIWREFGAADPEAFWALALAAQGPVQARYFSDWRAALVWVPNLLFDTINLPAVRVIGPEVSGGGSEDIGLALATIAPGNATRRYSAGVVHWRPPVDGRAPWLAADDYNHAERQALADSSEAVLSQLPIEARAELGECHISLCRPTQATLERVGWMAGAFWTPEIGFAPDADPQLRPIQERDLPVRHDSNAFLRGFLLVEADPKLARAVGILGEPGRLMADAHISGPASAGTAGLRVARVFWGADSELRFDVPKTPPLGRSQIFTDPKDGLPLLHGYRVETEGLRIAVDDGRVTDTVDAVMASFEDAPGAREAVKARLLRFRIESRGRAIGLPGHDLRLAATLIAAAIGDSQLRGQLVRLLRFWEGTALRDFFLDIRNQLLGQHPLMTEARVRRAGDLLATDDFQQLLQESLQEIRDDEALPAYLRSALLHSLALRLKALVSQVGQGDERKLLAHVALPLQFDSDAGTVITVCEAGAGGDGTIRGIIDGWDEAQALVARGFLEACRNAEEDALVRRFWSLHDEHSRWREADARDPAALAAIGAELGTDAPLPAVLVRILFDREAIEAEPFALYDIAEDLENVRARLAGRLQRPLEGWELASAAVGEAIAGTAPVLQRLRAAFEAFDPNAQGSLGADAQLAEQVFRLGAPLCVDGCRACVHQPSDLMHDSLMEASVSRSLLARFLG